MPVKPSASRLLAAGIAFGLLLAVAGHGLSQSGRRAKSKVAPTATPEATPAPEAVKEKPKPKPQLSFVVAMDRSRDFAGIPSYTYSTVMRHCVDRLNDGSKATAADRDMGRSDAIKRVRAEKESNLVWLQLRPDTVSQAQGTSSLANVYLQYTVFAPTTAKILASGSTYPHMYRNKGIILRPNTSGVTDDYQLSQAAEEAAERILKSVHPPVPFR